MTWTPELLNRGQLASSQGALYTAPAGMLAIVESVVYFNTSGGSVTVRAYYKRTTTTQFLTRSLPASERLLVNDKLSPIYLSPGDSVEGDAGSANVINFLVFGQTHQIGG